MKKIAKILLILFIIFFAIEGALRVAGVIVLKTSDTTWLAREQSIAITGYDLSAITDRFTDPYLYGETVGSAAEHVINVYLRKWSTLLAGGREADATEEHIQFQTSQSKHWAPGDISVSGEGDAQTTISITNLASAIGVDLTSKIDPT